MATQILRDLHTSQAVLKARDDRGFVPRGRQSLSKGLLDQSQLDLVGVVMDKRTDSLLRYSVLSADLSERLT